MSEIGTEYNGALVETCTDTGKSRPRVRALHPNIPSIWRVEFPRDLREDNPIGTRFRCDLKVCQKHNSDGSIRGQQYLVADTETICKLSDYTPDRIIRAVLNPDSRSGRSYSYIGPENLFGHDLAEIRASALEVLPQSEPMRREISTRLRSQKIKAYVHLRANGTCESCNAQAPFISRDGKPYLEIHHLRGLAAGGEDSIFNAAAICPNCHTEITHGINGQSLNTNLITKILLKENPA